MHSRFPLARGRLLALEATLVTLWGSAWSYQLAGRPPLLGIDDANITQVYGRHLAQGLGYVYNADGERVEGSTSLAWTLLNALAFAISDAPEPLLLALSFVLTAAPVHCALRLADTLAESLGTAREPVNVLFVVCLSASPAFFLWSVWTLMDFALWSTTLFALLLALARGLRGELPRGLPWLAVLAVLVRPEGPTVAFGLIALAALLARERKPYLLALVVLLLAWGASTGARLWYFGYPFPNTYYAKVSTNLAQQLKLGVEYTLKYLVRTPHIVTFVLAWPWLLAWRSTKVAWLCAATIAGTFALYVGLGGDHFPLHRFYQPLALLLPLALCIALARTREALPAQVWSGRFGGLASAAAALLFVGVAFADFAPRAYELRDEFEITVEGRMLADKLASLPTPPSVGVLAAGGFARAYPGHTYDLMGLNWIAMAHANPEKSGAIRAHAGFDHPTFWAASPQVLVFVGDRCQAGRTFAVDDFEHSALKGLDTDAAFQARYAPLALGCYLAYAHRELVPELVRTAQARPL